MPLYSTSISDRKRRKPHFYDSRLFIYIFGFFFLTSGWFWTFSYFFCALCPFSPAQLRISLWLSDDFGLFYTFSVLYVHFLLFSSVFLSGLRIILDFFTLFLCFMSILNCSAPYFSLVSGWFWTFLLLFLSLYPFSPAQLRISLWLPDNFGLFYCFSRLYVHFLLPGSVFPSGFRMILDFFPIFLSFMSIWKSTEVSGLRWIQKSQDCEEYRNLQTAKSTEVSKLRWVQKPPTCDEFRSLQTAMSSEASNLRRVQKSPNYDEHGSLQPA